MAETYAAILDQVERLIWAGKKNEARALLAGHLKREPSSARAWWLLSQAVESADQEKDCLERVLRLDPGHSEAQERLAGLRATAEPGIVPPQFTSHIPEMPPSSPVDTPITEFGKGGIHAEEEFDLFKPGAFEQALSSVPTEHTTIAPQVTIRSELLKPGSSLTLPNRVKPVVKSEVPTWAEPPLRKEKGKASSSKKRTWIVDAIIIGVVLCLLVTVVGYFGLTDLIKGFLPDFQATSTVAVRLTSQPANTQTPSVTHTASFTSPPTETRTQTDTPVPTSPTPTLQYSLTATPIPPGAIGISAGKYPPEFSLQELTSGEQVSLADYTGRPILLFFWATWCSYCRAEIYTLKDLYANYQDDGLVLLAVNTGDFQDDVEEYYTTHGINFPVLLDPGREISLIYEAFSMPHHVFISVNGRIMYVVDGQLDYGELESKVKALMRTYPTSTP